MARYIDADKVSEKLKRYLMPNVDIDGTVTVEVAERHLLELINKTPTADVVEVKHGYWKHSVEFGFAAKYHFWHCSLCGVASEDEGNEKYCRECGAKMDAVNYESTKE